MNEEPRVLLVGYNGANNAGAEARVVAAINDVRAVLGPRAVITVPTINVANTSRYIEGAENVRLEPIPVMYFMAMRRLVREHDLILLVEGSVYMDTWSPLLLWYFLWPTRLAHAHGKPCLAYAVDVGEASPTNQEHIRREASKTDLIVTRTHSAAETLRRWGVSAPIQVTADLAVNFPVDPSDAGLLTREWPEAKHGVVGISMVDFYRFPVVIQPWGSPQDRYSWPVYFAHTPQRRLESERLAAGYAAMVDSLVQEHGKHVALMCMEELDEAIAHRVRSLVRHREQTRIFTAREHNASQMTSLVRGLDVLITARYHGSVLALGGLNPQIAFGHDLRLKTLYEELGLYPDYFVDAHEPQRFESLNDKVKEVLADPESELMILRRGYQDQLERSGLNRELLSRFVSEHGWRALRWAA